MVGAATVLHRRGGRAVVAVSVGVAVGVPEEQRRIARPGSIETAASKPGAVVPTESLRRLALVADDVARNAQGRAARVPGRVFPVFGSQLLAVVTVVAVCGFVA